MGTMIDRSFISWRQYAGMASPSSRIARVPVRPSYSEDGRRQLEAFGQVLSIGEWSRRIGITPRALKNRLERLPPEVALTLSVHAHYGDLPEPGAPRSWTWNVLPWEEDPYAQAFVEEHPNGATLEEVGEVLGVTRERVRQIEEVAKRKLRRIERTSRYRVLEDLR